MGLDIYFHKAKGVKHPSMTITDYKYYADKEATRNFIEKIRGIVKAVAASDNVDDDFITKNVKAPLEGTISGWEFDNIPTNENTALPGELKTKLVDWLFNLIDWHSYAPADAYFRKVNFIYRYFGERLEDEQCLVTKADLEDLIDKCKAVLEKRDEEFSKETLPTVSGFFFGSTEYNKWYYESCENAIKQFTDLIKDFDEDKDVIWVDMSW
jgi:hypothetical protein